MDHPCLSVRNLQAGYGRAQVLFGVSFDVRPGEVVTLLGRNGMGRSTTVKCLFGLLGSSAGEIEVGGLRTRGLAPFRIARQGLALVPEGRQIFTALTVEENLIATARDAAGATRARAWTLERVYGFFPRLRERRSNLGSQLSGGEQQMLSIGRALLTNPLGLILDEATEGLAPLIVDEIWRVIGTIRETGIATIVVDRDYRRVLAHADRALVLQKGLA
ncbi:MAG TPA: ABC transporter ATP-binding protein, partial [Burkholderiaceae bacterium]